MNSEENSSWQYNPGQGSDAQPDDSGNSDVDSTTEGKQSGNYSWTAVEYVEHVQDSTWYLTMLLLMAVITVAIYFITKDYFAVGTTAVAVAIVGIYAHRKPRQITYELTNNSLIVGEKRYSYSLFRSFSVYHEGQFSSLNLAPTKRLMAPVAAYFNPQDEQKITQIIGEHVPYQEHKLDIIERIARRLRL